MEAGKDLSVGKDSPAKMTTADEVGRTQWEQEQPEHRRQRNSWRMEGEEVEEAKGEAAKRDHGEEENTDRLSAASASASASISLASNPTQLAIFFDGAIYVYDAIPLEKAQAIILIAAATAAAAHTASPVLTSPPSLQSSSDAPTAAAVSPQNQQQLLANTGSSLCKLQEGLPIARRNSLQRFLEKRRDRLVSRAPYPPPMKSTDGPGSGSGSEASTPGEHY